MLTLKSPDAGKVVDCQDAGKPGSVAAVRHGRLSANLTGNVSSFIVNTLIALWFTPYLIRRLGVAGYGLIPLSTTMISYLALITLALNSAVGRYLTIGLERGDHAQANRVFNTSLFGTLVLLLVPSGVGVWLALHAERILVLPAGYEEQGRLLVICVLAAFLITEAATPFDVATFCRNRFDLRGALAVCASLVRVGSVVWLFTAFSPKIWHAGLGYLAAALISALGSVTLWRKLTPSLVISARLFDVRTLRKLTGTGGWIVIDQVGTLLYLSIDLLVVNRLFGPTSSGQYAAVLQWSALLRGVAGAIAGVFSPTFLYFYARGDVSGLIGYARRSVKFLGLLLALPIGLVCGFSRPLLSLWLGPEFSSLAPLMSLMTLHLCVNLAVLPLFGIQVATNNVRWPGIVTCILGAMNFGLAIFLAGRVGWGMYGVAAAGAIMLTARSMLFTPIYGAHILGTTWWVFHREMLPVVLSAGAIALAGWYLSSHLHLTTWWRLIGIGVATSLIYVAVAYAAILSPAERAATWRLLPGRPVELQDNSGA